eukprot:TRINITY_DN2064_c0_g2_i1.p1 TRINITY_DN2064_c0_g2~~TRINITY_DN2064_c0_g2_i1.p1  ORF type:complete len:722 (+),score=142.70 TRINITY_DN2064_c0_g2_i1:172-2337(+)
MPIRGFEAFLIDRKLVHTSLLEELKNTRVAVDGQVWLKKLNVNEPFQIAMGGTPMTLMHAVQEDLAAYNDAGIKPQFVFNGLNLIRKDKPFASSDGRIVKRSTAWTDYAKGKLDSAITNFLSAEKHIALNFINNLFPYFIEHNVEFMRAPYLSWAQLAWLNQRQNTAQAVYAGCELLLFGVTKLILDIDWKAGTFQWVEHKEVLNNLNMTSEQFVDSCILAGFDYSATFPPLSDGFLFRKAYETIKAHASGLIAVQSQVNAGHPGVLKTNYLDIFLKARALIRNHIIFDYSCTCEPLNKDPNQCPADLHDIIGSRLPNEVYFFLTQGIVSTQVINNLVSGSLIEAPPLVDSDEYRLALDKFVDMRSKALSLLSASLHEYYQQKKVITIRWYNPSVELEITHSGRLTGLNNIRWHVVSSSQLKKELQRQKIAFNNNNFVDQVTLCAIQALRVHHHATKEPEELLDIATTKEELLATLFHKGLELTDYLTSVATSTPSSPYASYELQPTKFARVVADVVKINQEEAMLFLELVRRDILTGKTFNTQPKVVMEGTTPNPHENEINLLSRVFSILHMSFNTAKGWEGPIDYDLMAFNSILKALNRSLRNLYEMLFLTIILRRKTVVSPHDYALLSTKLPFFQESNTALGIVLKAYLSDARSEATLAKRFPTCTNVWGDLQKGFAFWDQCVKLVRALQSELSQERVQEFEKADAYLRSIRGSASVS